MKPAQHPTALRVQTLLHDQGLDARIVEFEQPTRTMHTRRPATPSAGYRRSGMKNQQTWY
jgi:hypothetical protein